MLFVSSVAYSYLELIDPDLAPDSAIFVINLQDTNKKLYFFLCFSAYYRYFLKSTFTSFFKDKKSQRSHKSVGIAGFLTIFA